jgi:hypothetical protein
VDIPKELITIPEDGSAWADLLETLLNSTRHPNRHDLALLLSTIANIDLCSVSISIFGDEGDLETYIILVNVTLRPFGDLVLIDTDLDGLAGIIDSRAQRQIGREVILGIVSNLLGANTEVSGLHDER